MRNAFLIIFAACAGICAIYFIDHCHCKHWQRARRTEILALADLYQNRLESSIANRLDAVSALKALFILHPQTSASEFGHFADLLMQTNPPIRALQYADATTRVSYVYPPRNNEITIREPMLLIADAKRGPFVKKAISQKCATAQGPFNLRQGGVGMAVRNPIFIDDRFIGLAIGIYDVPVLIEEAFAGMLANPSLAVQLQDADQHVFSGPETTGPDWIEKSIVVADTHWTMNIGWQHRPEGPSTTVRVIIWLCGMAILTSLLVIMVMAFSRQRLLAYRVKQRTRELNEKNILLAKEVGQRKSAQRALQRSEEKLRMSLQGSGMSFWEWYPKTDKIRFDDNWAEMLGYAPSEIEYHFSWWQTSIHPDSRDIFKQALDNYLAGRSHRFELEYQIKTKPGQWKWAWVAGKCLTYDKNDKPLHFIGTHRDITAHKQIEFQLRRQQADLQRTRKMESIGTLAGGIAHEFNNILAIIIGNIELAIEDVPDTHPAQSFLDETFSAALRGKQVVSRILQFVQKMPDQGQLTEIAPTIHECVALIQSTGPKSIEIESELLCCDEKIAVNPADIKRIFLNLYTNAMHAMESDSGILSIRLEPIHLDDRLAAQYDGAPPGDYVKLTVADTGHGIDSNIIDRIFEPYFTTKEVDQGLGMGLAIVYGIVKTAGGALQARNRPDAGAAIEVLFPSV